MLDVRARTVSDEMAIAAAQEIAACALERDLREDAILPLIDDPEVPPRVAVAAAMTAQRQGLAQLAKDARAVREEARTAIERARAATQALLREGLIPAPPD